jgi:hypothetical protein
MTTFKQWLQKFTGTKKTDSVSGAIAWHYYNLRHAEMSYASQNIIEGQDQYDFYQNIAETAGSKIKGINVYNNGKWIYRSINAVRAPENNDKEESIRLSLNVRPCKELIAALDSLLFKDENRKYIRNYKVPAEGTSVEWEDRHDPCTIYCWNTSPNMLSHIAKVIAPFVRKGPELIGEKVADGIYLDEEPTQERIKALLARAKTEAGIFYKEIEQIPDIKGRLSAGQYKAIVDFLDKFGKDKTNIDPNSIKQYAFDYAARNINIWLDKVETVKSRDGKTYKYFVPRDYNGYIKGPLDTLKERLCAFGLKPEEYKSGLFKTPVLRVLKDGNSTGLALAMQADVDKENLKIKRINETKAASL